MPARDSTGARLRIGDFVMVTAAESYRYGQKGTVTGTYEKGTFVTLSLEDGDAWDAWACHVTKLTGSK